MNALFQTHKADFWVSEASQNIEKVVAVVEAEDADLL
jgi:phage terminase large subunit-like protein